MSETGNMDLLANRLEGPPDRRRVAKSALAMFLPVFALAVAVTATILFISGNAETLAYRNEEQHTVVIQAVRNRLPGRDKCPIIVPRCSYLVLIGETDQV